MEGVCAAVLDLPPAEARSLAEGVDELATRLPPTARAGLAAGAALLESICLARTGRRLDRLSPAERERLLDQLLDTPATAGLLDALKAPVLLVHGARTAGPELKARLTGPPARPDAGLDVTPAPAWPDRALADVVVVGSGAGGAMVADRMARAGLTTVVVEEGRRHTVDEFRDNPVLERFHDLYRDGAPQIALGRPPLILPVGRGVGGTTLVNSGTCYRTPEQVLRRWRDRHGLELADPGTFGPYLDEVEALLQVAPVPAEVMGNNGRLALAGAAKLGWSAHPIRRNAPGCAGSCQCAVGCPRNAKFGVHLNALPRACAAGARIVSEARVERLLHGGGRVSGVRALRADGSVLEILAPWVVVAAGATETPALLRRSGLARHPHLGRNLAVHPVVSVGGWFAERVDATRGVLQSVGVDQLHESHGILIESTATPPGMGSMTLPGAGRRLAEQLDRIAHLASIGAMVADRTAPGRVLGSRRSVVRYDLERADAERLGQAIGAMGRIMFAAGAEEVATGIHGHHLVRDAGALDEAVAHLDPRHLHVAAFHPTGTARMGADPETHPVDAGGRLRGLDGAWVADASVLPTCAEVNPQVTLMALAAAIADNLAAAAGAGG
jgi:choline dehydrogenase-like flavoprotein